MKVSVIMGIYNCASTLQEALDSLYAQTLLDFEIILCDDGSLDETYALAKQNEQSHSNIKLLRNEKNQGLNITLNNCLQVASGEYIARMDGDDVSMPERLQKEAEFLDDHPEYALVSCPMLYFDENGEFGRGTAKLEPQVKDFEKSSPFCHAPCMVRRRVFQEVGGYTVSPWLLRHEDYNLWTKIYAKGYKGYNLKECLYAMRDDRNATKRRVFRGRINGIYARWVAYRTLHFSLFGFIKFAVESIIKGIMPRNIYEYFHQRRFKANRSV